MLIRALLFVVAIEEGPPQPAGQRDTSLGDHYLRSSPDTRKQRSQAHTNHPTKIGVRHTTIIRTAAECASAARAPSRSSHGLVSCKPWPPRQWANAAAAHIRSMPSKQEPRRSSMHLPPLLNTLVRAAARPPPANTAYVIAVVTSLNCGGDVLCLRAVEPDSTGQQAQTYPTEEI
jgi:hypothetical protein